MPSSNGRAFTVSKRQKGIGRKGMPSSNGKAFTVSKRQKGIGRKGGVPIGTVSYLETKAYSKKDVNWMGKSLIG